MLNFLLSISMLVSCFSIFGISICMNNSNRIILNTPRSIFEKSINVINYSQEKEDKLYFDEIQLTYNLKSYYSGQLKKYVVSYYVEIMFMSSKNSGICFDDKCDVVDISVKVTLPFNIRFERELIYSIKDNRHG